MYSSSMELSIIMTNPKFVDNVIEMLNINVSSIINDSLQTRLSQYANVCQFNNNGSSFLTTTKPEEEPSTDSYSNILHKEIS